MLIEEIENVWLRGNEEDPKDFYMSSMRSMHT